jgi:hypothetical protein
MTHIESHRYKKKEEDEVFDLKYVRTIEGNLLLQSHSPVPCACGPYMCSGT